MRVETFLKRNVISCAMPSSSLFSPEKGLNRSCGHPWHHHYQQTLRLEKYDKHTLQHMLSISLLPLVEEGQADHYGNRITLFGIIFF